MFLVALTGGIASGKSTVSNLFKQQNIPVIDADEIAREVVKPGSRGLKAILKHFGRDLLDANGELDRKKLGDVIFNDENKRKTLNRITHPLITRRIFHKCLFYFLKFEPFVILDLPLFYESAKMKPFIHKAIVVSCSEEQQLERLVKRNNLTLEEARIRIDAQIPLSRKREMADYVIHNHSSHENLTILVNDHVKQLKNSKFHWKIRILAFLIASSVILLFWQLFIFVYI